MKNLVIIFLVLISYAFFVSCQDQVQEDGQTEPIKDPQDYKKIYQNLLIKKRQVHHEAINRIRELKDAKKEKEMITLVLKKLFETLKFSLEKLSKAQQQSGDKKGIPIDDSTSNDISMAIENTAFAADLALHFPKQFHKLYDKNQEWHLILEAAIGLCLNSGLPDSETLKAISLMSQELEIVDKEPDFVNPYKNDRSFAEEMASNEVDNKPKKKERKKRPRGPGLSGGKGEL